MSRIKYKKYIVIILIVGLIAGGYYLDPSAFRKYADITQVQKTVIRAYDRVLPFASYLFTVNGTISVGEATYRGEIVKRKATGQGSLIYPDGREYVGEFVDGKINGEGTLTASDGRVYVAAFVDGEIQEQGNLTYPDGREYTGELVNGDRHGQGAL